MVETISVCICTFRRTHLLPRLFASLAGQKTGGVFDFSLVVVDNDSAGSSRATVSELASRFQLQVAYDIEPERNFALVRNRALGLAPGDYIAFVDDDEVPLEDWLLQLHATANKYAADGVLGPVRPYFHTQPPDWLLKSGLCERPRHPTGMVMHWKQTRTGNTLIRRAVFEDYGIWFDPHFGTGGEDMDFFRRAIAAGCRFFWSEEAPVYELVPAERQQKSYHLKRALLQGAISCKYEGRRGNTAELAELYFKTGIAAVIYTLSMPAFWLIGMHAFMKYLVKDFHHIGRLFAFMGLEVFTSRNF